MLDTGPGAVTNDFHAGEIGCVKRYFGHCIKNTRNEDLIFLETFRSAHYEEIFLSDWLTHVPPQMVTTHLNVPADVIAKWPDGLTPVVPV